MIDFLKVGAYASGTLTVTMGIFTMQSSSRLLKYSNIVMLGAFMISILVQFNDPDASAWIVIYGAAAACCFLQLQGRPVKIAALVLAMIALSWALSLLPSVIGQASPSEIFASITMQTRAVEEAREIGGLLLIGIWMLVLWFAHSRFHSFTRD